MARNHGPVVAPAIPRRRGYVPRWGGHAKIFMVKRVNVKKLMNAYQYSLCTSTKRNNI